jgi:hypothetical protein
MERRNRAERGVTVPQADWTIGEAASWLDPPVTARQLRVFIRELGIEPSGRRRTGHSGPGVKTYDVSDLIALHAAIAPWLARLGPRRLRAVRRLRLPGPRLADPLDH